MPNSYINHFTTLLVNILGVQKVTLEIYTELI